MKIAHVLYYTPPALYGYTIRSRYILGEQRARGHDVVGISHPVMMSRGARPQETIDGVRYVRLTRRGTLFDRFRNRVLGSDAGNVRRLGDDLVSVAREEKPDVLHAHSPHVMARAALRCRDKTRIPVIYEVRGLWEDSAAVRGEQTTHSLRYQNARARETEAFHLADRVVVISRGLEKELQDRGVPEDKIDLVPNGASPPETIPEPRVDLLERYGLGHKTVAGYVGSIWRIEGLETLLSAFARVAAEAPEVRLLLVGDGPSRAPLERQAAELGVSDRVVFTGQVPHDEIWDYYRIIDVLVVPRPKNRVSDLVTPIKPLEAMGLGRALLVSDVGGLTELVDDGRTGLAFPPGDEDGCAAKLLELMRNAEFRIRLGESARRWVRQERSWTTLVARYDSIYEKLLSRGDARRG